MADKINTQKTTNGITPFCKLWYKMIKNYVERKQKYKQNLTSCYLKTQIWSLPNDVITSLLHLHFTITPPFNVCDNGYMSIAQSYCVTRTSISSFWSWCKHAHATRTDRHHNFCDTCSEVCSFGSVAKCEVKFLQIFKHQVWIVLYKFLQWLAFIYKIHRSLCDVRLIYLTMIQRLKRTLTTILFNSWQYLSTTSDLNWKCICLSRFMVRSWCFILIYCLLKDKVITAYAYKSSWWVEMIYIVL